jgi:hypothetical protein
MGIRIWIHISFDADPDPTFKFVADPDPHSATLPATHRKIKKERLLTDGRGWDGVGKEPSHTKAKKPGPQ